MTRTDGSDRSVSTSDNAGDGPIRPLMFSSYVIERWRRNMLPAVAYPGIFMNAFLKKDPQIFASI
ncbi:hypothetical protein H3V02_08020 [Bifidobacterium sp. W8106]|uniref:ABC transporter permease n=1 Tax=Bifidobacterium choladohabitans TaxID=2750947 RepID=A0ABS0QYY5_9BIFI|nr:MULTISPECIES: hypothetical protein [Bifidobacterium]MBI0143115.1 hypothetical protein [Bifidobacterium choladohabitans]MBI0143620.1 hypothetical protein [Bifidobacterium choladohabitans]MBI0147451.1 hypothetical protein [Bifidobacterium sp. W8104]